MAMEFLISQQLMGVTTYLDLIYSFQAAIKEFSSPF